MVFSKKFLKSKSAILGEADAANTKKKSIGEEGVRVKFGFLVANLLHTNFTHLLSAANGLTKRLQKWLRNKQRLCQIVFHFRYFSKFYFLCLIIFHEKFPLFRDRQLVWLFHR